MGHGCDMYGHKGHFDCGIEDKCYLCEDTKVAIPLFLEIRGDLILYTPYEIYKMHKINPLEIKFLMEEVGRWINETDEGARYEDVLPIMRTIWRKLDLANAPNPPKPLEFFKPKEEPVE